MTAPLELFVLPWGVYPRRVLIYLAEKGLLSSPLIKIVPIDITQDGVQGPENTPKGTFPVMRLPNGTLLRQSVAIMEYFEDICDNPDPTESWQADLAKAAKVGTMRGDTAENKARVRDIISLVDEVTTYFGFACHKGSRLFSHMETLNPVASKLAFEFCTKSLKSLAQYYQVKGRVTEGNRVTIADCMLFSVLQFSTDLYGVDLMAGAELQHLRDFYEEFGRRGDVKQRVEYPEPVKALAPQWIPIEEPKLGV